MMLKLLKQGTPRLNSNEEALESWRVNRVQSPQRAVGGSLWLTDQRLVFAPNNMEQKMGGNAWEIPLQNLAAVGKVAPQLTQIFAGGLRSRLRVTTRHGEELFVVNGVEGVQQRLAQFAA